MQPYVIRQGDYLLSLAYRFGFDADAVWKDAKNTNLQQLRQNPNILYPGDVLYIPDENVPPVMKTLATGTTNTFVSNAPTVTVSVTFTSDDGSALASMPCQVQELPELTGLQTDEHGLITLDVPVTFDAVTVTFASSGDAFELQLGAMDPVDTPSGMFKRLQNLGLIDAGAAFDDAVLQAAVYLFKLSVESGATGLPPPQDADESSTESNPATDAPPASSSAPSMEESDPPPSSQFPTDSSLSLTESSPAGSYSSDGDEQGEDSDDQIIHADPIIITDNISSAGI